MLHWPTTAPADVGLDDRDLGPFYHRRAFRRDLLLLGTSG
ncbi:hypothetical protein CGMCC3_g11970 [Colletotrichum fructicola]|nr:uncharacterized protein CGMCC3_g11970 [Colletotrichum fructicola]KAE9571847.1 hypothetical protein CGMCC3_g11970 [Colletotrichum fructicola]